MMLQRRTVMAGLLLPSLGAFTRPRQPDHPVAPTTNGPVRGYRDGSVIVFKGIRYGADTGPRRFQPLTPPRPWTEPAGTFAFGDTWDTPRMTVGIGFAADTWPGTSNAQLRHSQGMLNYAFVDGHAKAIKVQAGFMGGAFNGRFIMVADPVLGRTAYCTDPSAIINTNPDSGDGMNIPSGIACGDITAWIRANYAPCAPGATPGSNCRFNN